MRTRPPTPSSAWRNWLRGSHFPQLNTTPSLSPTTSARSNEGAHDGDAHGMTPSRTTTRTSNAGTSPSRPTHAKARAGDPANSADTNEVRITGRISAVVTRELADGCTLVTFRVTVSDGAGRHDTVECASVKATVLKRARGITEGERVQVDGALRRTFWKSGQSLASRTSIDVATLKSSRR